MTLPPCLPGPVSREKKIAVLSPSMAAPAYGPAVHEQAMARLQAITGMEIIEYPTTRQLGASAQARAADVSKAFANDEVAAIMATIGGNDQIMVLAHLDEAAITANPKPFFGYSDNTHLHNWLWQRGIASFYGGSTQVHLGAGPRVDDEQETSLLAGLFGGDIELTNPQMSEDYGIEWSDPLATSEFGLRRPSEPWRFSGPQMRVSGHTWGGCIQVLEDILVADHFRSDTHLQGAILLLEVSEDILPPMRFTRFMRSLGERGLLARLAGLLMARPPATSFDYNPPLDQQEAYRHALYQIAEEAMARYNPKAVVCCGVPFGHTRPQWVVPYGGRMTLDGNARKVWAHYC